MVFPDALSMSICDIKTLKHPQLSSGVGVGVFVGVIVGVGVGVVHSGQFCGDGSPTGSPGPTQTSYPCV